MVPRSYPFRLQSSPPSPPHRPSEKMNVARPPRPAPSTSNIPRPQMAEKRRNRMSRPWPQPIQDPTETMQSAPVVIPPRTPTKTSMSTQSMRVRGMNGGRGTPTSKNHRLDAIPSAVAALLAVTEIPRMPPRRRKGSAMNRRISMDELIHEWKQDESDTLSSVVGSPLDVLLDRVDEFEDDCDSFLSLDQERDSIASRSISSESMPTIPPSLDLDTPSISSNWDSLSSPGSFERSGRRSKLVQSPPKEDCILDHPLLRFHPNDYDEVVQLVIPDVVTSAPPTTARFRSFKSNLTASLEALKSAAKSFSNFTAPSIPPDDLLTRSLLSPKFTSEMRPKHLEGLPSPALRRYLNPHPAPISPTELSMQLHDSLLLDSDNSTAPMIQMQTYDRRSRSPSRKRKTDPYSEAGRALPASPAVRQREPRENSDFLRVIVLEMNMRRVGKLDAKTVGRARIWLPPRKLLGSAAKSPSVPSGIPDRWICTLVDNE
jgi:hypothetical protein